MHQVNGGEWQNKGKPQRNTIDEYAEFMKQSAAPDYGSVDGLQKLLFLCRNDKDVTDFLLVTNGA